MSKTMEASVLVTDYVITDDSMEDPVYRAVIELLRESIGQQIMNYATLTEENTPSGDKRYGINIKVKDLNKSSTYKFRGN